VPDNPLLGNNDNLYMRPSPPFQEKHEKTMLNS